MGIHCVLLTLFLVYIAFYADASTIPSSRPRWISKISDKIGCKDCNWASKVSSIGAETVTSAGSSFVRTLPLTVSLSMAMNVGKLPDIRNWLATSFSEGTNMARLNAVLKGSETLFKNVREKDDRVNSWLGTGIAVATSKFKKGPVEMAIGFGQGFGLSYGLDKLVHWGAQKEHKGEKTDK